MVATSPKPPLTYVRVLDDLAHLGQGVGDRRVVELDLVGDPLVVDIGAVRAQDVVLEPVGQRPAGRVTRADAGAPRLRAGGGDLVGQRDQFVVGRRDGVALGLEGLRRVPDQRLEVGAVRDGEVDVVDRAVALDVRGVVLVDVVALVNCGTA